MNNCTFSRDGVRIRCERCDFSIAWTKDGLPKRNCRIPLPPAPNFGPGTELASLIKQLGGTDEHGCGCKAMIEQMNRWGVDACREHRAEIVAQLTASAAKWGIADWLSGGWKAVTSGLLFTVANADPIGSLVDLAIQRATERQGPQ